MKVIIAGSRDIQTLGDVMNAFIASGFMESATEIVSGGANGVDAGGEEIARILGLPVARFPADWDKHGRAAGPIRNAQMADYGDALVLIWDGSSPGSASMKRLAQRRGLPIYEVIRDQ